MSPCEDRIEALSALADGELSGAEEAALREHLRSCEGCRAYYADLTAMRAAFAGEAEAEPPEGFAAGVMQAVRREKKRRRAHWIGAAACAAVLALALLPLTALNGASAPMAKEIAAEEETAAEESVLFSVTGETEAGEAPPVENAVPPAAPERGAGAAPAPVPVQNAPVTEADTAGGTADAAPEYGEDQEAASPIPPKEESFEPQAEAGGGGAEPPDVKNSQIFTSPVTGGAAPDGVSVGSALKNAAERAASEYQTVYVEAERAEALLLEYGAAVYERSGKTARSYLVSRETAEALIEKLSLPVVVETEKVIFLVRPDGGEAVK